MNRLQFASSPYLLQHAHNPVDWYEWGVEALAKAKQEKPAASKLRRNNRPCTATFATSRKANTLFDHLATKVGINQSVKPRLSIRARDDGEGIFETVGTLVRSP